MFILKIHTADPSAFDPNSQTNELRGVPHLFRELKSHTLSDPSVRSTLLYIVAVPNSFSQDDFLKFCGDHVDNFNVLIFIRNDETEEGRYSVLIQLVDQLKSDSFYCCLNLQKFQPSEGELCHIYFLQSVEYTDSAESASAPPPTYVELPTCPICLERLDYDTSVIQTALCNHCSCSLSSEWTYLSCPVCRLCQHQEEKAACAVCGTVETPCVCLICGFVGCGRYEKGHAVEHCYETQHVYTLKLGKQQIWDYSQDKYVHRLNQSKSARKPVKTNFDGASEDARCSEIDVALFDSKVEAITNAYEHNFVVQMEKQRQYYETLLIEQKHRREAFVSKRKGIADKVMQNLQDRTRKTVEETEVIADMNEELVKEQENMRKRLMDIEMDMKSEFSSKDAKILDLTDTIRDIQTSIDVARRPDSDSIRGGTLLPLPTQSNPSTGSNSKRRTKSGRRRK